MNQPADADPSSRRIALLKPATVTDERVLQALQLLDSIVWACKGATHSAWTIASPEFADVVVVHRDDHDERIPMWKAQGKPVIEIATDSQSDATAPGVLVYPFRVTQVLALLNTLDEHLKAGQPAAEKPTLRTRDSSPGEVDPWAFVESLRTLRLVQNSEVWLVGRDSRLQVLWVRGDAVAYAADPLAVQAMRDGSLNLSKLALDKGLGPSPALPSRSGIELSWFAGYYASDHLAPALQAETRYRIARWPNFGLIRPPPSQVRIAAVLASTAGDIGEITSRANVSTEEATRILNALYACDVLVAVSAAESRAASKPRAFPEPRGGLAKFLRNLRKHLRIRDRQT